MSKTRAVGCLAGGGGFVIGFAGAIIVIGGGLGAGIESITGEGLAAGAAMLVVSTVVAFFAIRNRNQEVPLLQGLLIGAALASLFTGLCGAILMMSQ